MMVHLHEPRVMRVRLDPSPYKPPVFNVVLPSCPETIPSYRTVPIPVRAPQISENRMRELDRRVDAIIARSRTGSTITTVAPRVVRSPITATRATRNQQTDEGVLATFGFDTRPVKESVGRYGRGPRRPLAYPWAKELTKLTGEDWRWDTVDEGAREQSEREIWRRLGWDNPTADAVTCNDLDSADPNSFMQDPSNALEEVQRDFRVEGAESIVEDLLPSLAVALLPSGNDSFATPPPGSSDRSAFATPDSGAHAASTPKDRGEMSMPLDKPDELDMLHDETPPDTPTRIFLLKNK
jgi:hypothetical protein